MKNDEEKIAAIRDLIVRYGHFAGLPDLAFDDEGLLSFRFDDVELTLSLEPHQTEIVLRSALDLRQTTLGTEFLTNLVGANVLSIRNGLGSVGIDSDAAVWTWIDRFDPAPMDPEALHVRLNQAAKAVRFWRREIGELAAPAPAASSEDADIQFLRV